MIQIVGDDTPEKKDIAEEIRQGVEQFLSLPLLRIQGSCNLRREELLNSLAAYGTNDPLDFWGLPNTTVGKARDELTRPFQFVGAPDPIIINLQLNSHPRAPNASAFISLDPALAGLIFVLSDNIDPIDLCARDTRQPLLDVAFHEMLHLCGDAVPAEDGVVRHQFSGTEVIRKLLGSTP